MLMKKILFIPMLVAAFLLIESCGGGHSTVRIGIGVAVPGPYYGTPYGGRPHTYGRPSGGRYYPALEREVQQGFALINQQAVSEIRRNLK